MRVLFLPEVAEQFLKIAEILYDKGYMSFVDDAVAYSEELFRDIRYGIHLKVKRNVPEHLRVIYGSTYYSVFKKNRQTTWYVFYDIYTVGSEKTFLIRYLTNNHVVSHRLYAES